MTKAGSLHCANGGYLVLPIEGVLQHQLSWYGLKRAIQSGEIKIEEPADLVGSQAVKSLRPQSVPFDVKVVLVGSPSHYYLLHTHDEEFAELFKVKADFDTSMACDEDNIKDFLSLLCTMRKKEKLLNMDSSGAAAMLEYAVRLAGDRAKISTQFGNVADLAREASFWAQQEEATTVSQEHVKKALEQKVYRSNLIQERLNEMIERGSLFIDTESEVVGQVNGLSVITLGDYPFGRPSRITASVGPGRGGLVDIEREIKLGGPLHSKGVLIISGYLTGKFARDFPLTLSGRLVFEQSYQGVDGDSASSTELYTLLSALAEVPIRQGIAVTGSVNQHGDVQPIGGVNEKIEGFFEVCRQKGLTGDQGVMIPESNIKNLMLKPEVVEAVHEGKFNVWAVGTIDEGLEILTGKPAGELDSDGHYPEGTINHLVDRRLRKYAKIVRDFGRDEPPD
jgi:predicted ATP-dependent protease